MERILIVDDDRSIRELLSMHLEERGYEVAVASTGAEGFRLVEEAVPSAIILDMRLPDMSGIDLIPELRKRAVETPVLMITAHHDMSTTILAMKAGAFDYIHKPIDIEAFDVALDRALEVRRISRGADVVSVESQRPFRMDDLVGTSPAMQQLFKDLGRVAASHATVLIQGESGTGKELIARVIHSYSSASRPFIAINCSAIVDTLLESELFGHEKGSFTGAVATKVGKFELADDGSLFLDEIGELSQNLQAKLLRVLQEREFERVGGVKRIPVRARILAATNRDLASEVPPPAAGAEGRHPAARRASAREDQPAPAQEPAARSSRDLGEADGPGVAGERARAVKSLDARGCPFPGRPAARGAPRAERRAGQGQGGRGPRRF